MRKDVCVDSITNPAVWGGACSTSLWDSQSFRLSAKAFNSHEIGWTVCLLGRCVVDHNTSETSGYLQQPGPVVCGGDYLCGVVRTVRPTHAIA